MESNIYKHARFLIVDDEQANIRVLEHLLDEWGCYNIESTTDSYQALPLFLAYQPDIVLLDLMMPELDGFGVMEQLAKVIPPHSYLPILVLTADATTPTRRRALSLGARDFLTKPFDAVELSLRIHNLLDSRFLHLQLQEQNQELEERVQERTQRLEIAELETIECLAVAAEYRDDDTGQHAQRVGVMAGRLARCIGISEEQAALIQRAAPLHDIGKIGISDLILLKPGKLTDKEFERMKTHSNIGHQILTRHHTPLLQLAASIAVSHHERWDGSGYPNGLSSEDIPIEGQLVAIADVFDALTHERPYKPAWTIEEAVAEIRSQAGLHFNPHIVEKFCAHVDELCEPELEETEKSPL